MPDTHLFVYGTLRPGSDHPMGRLLRDGARRIGPGSIRARLYLIDDPDAPGENSYPGALPSGNPADRVHGELFRLHDPAALLHAFDAYEACSADWPEPHEFLRRTVSATLADGQSMQAICYLYTWDVSTAQPIPSGRFEEVARNTR